MRLSNRAWTMMFFVVSVMLFVFALPRILIRLIVVATLAFGFQQVYKGQG